MNNAKYRSVSRETGRKGKGASGSKAQAEGKRSTPKTADLAPDATAPKFPVVGVGASAGALEAFTQLLRALPPNPGMAFVLVPHLDPTHESALTELLGRASKIPVVQVHDGIKLRLNHVFVLPPGSDITIVDGRLCLEKRRRSDGPHMPIDLFFRSLAAELRSNAIGVILSGTASDGTLGVTAIKGAGGFTIAQDSQSARYDGMPNSAVASGAIDLVLPPEKIAQELLRIRHHLYVGNVQADKLEPASASRTDQMAYLFRILKQVCRVDFSDYKPATIRRRILRRMALRHRETLEDYVQLLQEDRVEVEALYADILINVTSFFRDPAAFEALREKVYPAILKGRSPTDTIRLWVPGCSTGEEVYSHAISLLEFVTEARANVSVQIFGTDLSDAVVRRARTGLYKETIQLDITPERLKRFFNKVDGGYQIGKALRDLCVFANQNVFSDPPFSHIDLLSCRNVLIYLSQTLQKRVIPVFHYALRTGGFLMVGNTEGLVGNGSELFDLIHKKQKIYIKKSVPSPVAFGIPPQHFDARLSSLEPIHPAPRPESVRTPSEVQREADRLLLSRYVPAAAVVSANLELLQTRGHANRFLELPSGKATLNLLKIIKPGFLFELQKALEEASQTGESVRKDNLQVEVEGSLRTVSIEVIPFQAPVTDAHSFVIVFEEKETLVRVDHAQDQQPVLTAGDDAKDKLIGQIKRELVATKEYQQSIIEALEASNEELQSANEEIQSGNEELQSTNEELQTSKEELESANEELNTVNEEMQHRNYQLAQANNDLVNLLASVNIPILMLGSDLSLRRFTPKAEELLGLSSLHIGRSLVHVRLKINIPDLAPLMLEVMRDGEARQREFEHGKTWYRLRVTPYQTDLGKIEGVVAALFDISDIKNRSSRSKRSKR